MFELVVTSPFGAFAKGDRITDPETIRKVQASGNARHVVKVAVAAPPEPERAPAAPLAPPAPISPPAPQPAPAAQPITPVA